MKKSPFILCIVIAVAIFPRIGLSQIRVSKDSISFDKYDTISVSTKDCEVTHYHERSPERGKQMFSMHDDDIFNDTINNFSKLFIVRNGGYEPSLISTVPLDNIIILESRKLIIGLTKINAAPYKIVVYNYNGQLIYKGNLGTDMIRIEYEKLRALVREFPKLIPIFKANGNVIKQDKIYYIELTNDVRQILGDGFRAKYFSKEWLYVGSYLPFYITTGGSDRRQYRRIKGGYLSFSPYNEIIVINDIPYVLVLNNVEGGKSYIPLISNCDIEKELI